MENIKLTKKFETDASFWACTCVQIRQTPADSGRLTFPNFTNKA